MERKQIAQVLIPVVGTALLIIGVGALILIGEPNEGKDPKDKAIDEAKKIQADQSRPGSGDLAFPLDSAQWKDGPQGIKIWDVVEGSGAVCPEVAAPEMKYSGWFTNGKPFDNGTIQMSLGELIKGWQIGVPGMKEGGTRRLYIPWPLAYGVDGRGKIPPKADLIFEMELISVN